jgi:PAT family beta-lactamase induction signal transducer AmpG
MRLPNLLATRRGRLAAFFSLYVTEGIPLGFAATAVATQLRRQGVGPAEIGAFVGSFYLPWAFKWAFGPFIDVFASERLGRKRGWILATQVLMALTLLSTVLLTLPQQLGLFTAVLLVHNSFGAMQDVAIDALAVNTLREDERGLANGLMFAGASIGQLVGGSGVLFMAPYTGFQPTFFFVAGCILLVTVLIVLPMKEAPGAPRPVLPGSRLASAAAEMRDFAMDSFRSFLGTRGALSGLLFALLPAGAMCLGLALQSNLAVELGMSDDEVAWLNVWSTLINGAGCILGGWLSDHFGRRRMLAVFVALQSVPVIYMMNELARHGWVMPVDPTAPNRPAVPHVLVIALWIATLAYNLFNGLMYGTRSAAYMDVTNPRVAATQFTAYMAMLNLTISYTANWQGIAAEAWGYPTTLLVDAVYGLVCLAVLPFLKPLVVDGEPRWSDAGAARRARGMARVLAAGCLAWIPYSHWHSVLGAAQPIAGTLFTLIFVASALFLLASSAVLGRSSPGLARLVAWVAPLLFAMYARYYLDKIAGWIGADPAGFRQGAEIVMMVVAAVAGALLIAVSRRPWSELGVRAEPIAPEGAVTA